MQLDNISKVTGKKHLPVTVILPNRGDSHIGFKEIARNWELIRLLVVRSINGRYRDTSFGILWAFVQPLAYMLVLSTFFGLIARFDSGDIPYPLHILSGLVAFQFFSKSLSQGLTAISGNRGVLSMVYLPRIVFPVANMITSVIDFLFPATLLAAFLFYYGIAPTTNLLYLPLVLLCLLIAGSSAQLFMSVVSLRFKDMRMVVPVLSQMWFFATPIFYPLHVIPEKYQMIYGLNPMVGIVEMFRWCVLGYSELPRTDMLIMSALVLFLGVLVSLWVFKVIDKKIYQYL